MADKKQIPCLEGWFTMPPEEPQLIGNKCGSCGHYFFPKVPYCRNPLCKKEKPLEKVILSPKGTLVAYTVNHYPPPPPYMAAVMHDVPVITTMSAARAAVAALGVLRERRMGVKALQEYHGEFVRNAGVL